MPLHSLAIDTGKVLEASGKLAAIDTGKVMEASGKLAKAFGKVQAAT